MSIASVLPLSMSVGSGTEFQNCASVCAPSFPLPRVLLVVLVFSAELWGSVEYSSPSSTFHHCTTFELRGRQVLVTLSISWLIYVMDFLLCTLFHEGVEYSSPSFVECGFSLLIPLSLTCSCKDFAIYKIIIFCGQLPYGYYCFTLL